MEQTRVMRVYGFGERAEGTIARMPWAESHYCTADTIFLGWCMPLHTASAWENAITLPSGLPVDPSYGACVLLRSKLPGPGCTDLGRLGSISY